MYPTGTCLPFTAVGTTSCPAAAGKLLIEQRAGPAAQPVSALQGGMQLAKVKATEAQKSERILVALLLAVVGPQGFQPQLSAQRLQSQWMTSIGVLALERQRGRGNLLRLKRGPDAMHVRCLHTSDGQGSGRHVAHMWPPRLARRQAWGAMSSC